MTMDGSLLRTVEDYLYHISLHIPLWSILSHVLLAVILFTGQSIAAAGWITSTFFAHINEFLCSFAWVAWTLEGIVISYTWSPTLGLFIVFGRLLLAPYLFKDAYANPCGVFYKCLWHGLFSTWSVIHFFLYVSLEMVAAVCGVYYTTAYWNLIGETISRDHRTFLDSKFEYFLQASPMYGSGVEMFVTLLVFTPRVFLRPSIYRTLLESLITIYLIAQFQNTTGAMMNPMVAFSCTLPWHSLNWSDCFTHFMVFWVGPFIGTALAVYLAKIWAKRQHSE